MQLTNMGNNEKENVKKLTFEQNNKKGSLTYRRVTIQVHQGVVHATQLARNTSKIQNGD